jgi:hypothetical protein
MLQRGGTLSQFQSYKTCAPLTPCVGTLNTKKWLTKKHSEYRDATLGIRQSISSFKNLFFLFLVGWDRVSWYCGHYWPTVPAPDDRWWWRNWWNEDWQGKPKHSEKTCPSATLPTTNPTGVYQDLNPGLCDGKPATNCLSYGAATSRTFDETV